MEILDFVHKPVTEFHHPRKLDHLDSVRSVVLVAPGSLVLVVGLENDALAIDKTVVEGVSIAIRILRIVGSVDLLADDRLARPVIGVLDDLDRISLSMVWGPSRYDYGLYPYQTLTITIVEFSMFEFVIVLLVSLDRYIVDGSVVTYHPCEYIGLPTGTHRSDVRLHRRGISADQRLGTPN